MIPTVISTSSNIEKEKSSEALNILQIIWEQWKKLAHRIGTFQSRVILTLFYFTILLPVGIVFSLFKDILGIKTQKQSAWIAKVKQAETLEELREQS